MKAGAEVVAAQVFLFEVKLRIRMRAVNNGFNSLCSRHLANSLNRSDLASDVYLVGDQNQFSTWSDSFLKSGSDLIQVLRWNGNLHQLEHQSFATFTLPQGSQHPGVVLGSAENFITGFEIHAHQKDLQRLGGVSRDRDLLGIATEHLG